MATVITQRRPMAWRMTALSVALLIGGVAGGLVAWELQPDTRITQEEAVSGEILSPEAIRAQAGAGLSGLDALLRRAGTFNPEAVRAANLSGFVTSPATTFSPEAILAANAGAKPIQETLSPERFRTYVQTEEEEVFSPERVRAQQ